MPSVFVVQLVPTTYRLKSVYCNSTYVPTTNFSHFTLTAALLAFTCTTVFFLHVLPYVFGGYQRGGKQRDLLPFFNIQLKFKRLFLSLCLNTRFSFCFVCPSL